MKYTRKKNVFLCLTLLLGFFLAYIFLWPRTDLVSHINDASSLDAESALLEWQTSDEDSRAYLLPAILGTEVSRNWTAPKPELSVLWGKDMKTIENLLGPPDSKGEKYMYYHIWLRAKPGLIDSAFGGYGPDTLMLRFDENKIIRKISITS